MSEKEKSLNKLILLRYQTQFVISAKDLLSLVVYMETFAVNLGGPVGGPTEVAPPRNGGAPSNEFKAAEAKSKEAKSKETKSKEAKSKEAKSKEAKSKEAKSKEAKSKEVKSKEVKSKEVQSRKVKSGRL